MSIRECLTRILEEWPAQRTTSFSGNELARFLCKDFADEVRQVAEKSNSHVVVKASAGKGNWADIPWVAILDSRITNSTEHGVYPVYLFCSDGSGVYLSLNQGTTGPSKEFGRKTARNNLLEIGAKIRDSVPALSGWSKGELQLKASTNLGRSYQLPNIGARFYEKGRLPSEDSLRADLDGMMSLYLQVVTLMPMIVGGGDVVHGAIDSEMAELVESFKCDLKLCGMAFGDAFVGRYLSAVMCKRFLVLSGLSGSGKSLFGVCFARWLDSCGNEKTANGRNRHVLVSIGADWTSNENLLGYPDALRERSYRNPDNGALDLILRAKEDPDHPYFLILDEMNLSHVERYFADFLSAMESGEPIHLHDDTGGDWDGVPAKLQIPDNLFVIGTVNVDETTYMFSPKVLDRANVIEFRVSKDDMDAFLKKPVKPDLDKIAGQGAQYARAFVAEARQKNVSLDEELSGKVSAVLLEFFPQLQEAGAEFGYRTAHEICRFVYFHRKLSGDGWAFNNAMDAAIMQKLLPKLHGSKKKLGPVLERLEGLCEGRFTSSLEKIVRMRKRLSEHGFTSFAEA
jgi:5-methylcytosine-specific restriction protein B